MKGETFPRRGLAVVVVCDCSAVVPARDGFTLALSFNESGAAQVHVEQECHDDLGLRGTP